MMKLLTMALAAQLPRAGRAATGQLDRTMKPLPKADRGLSLTNAGRQCFDPGSINTDECGSCDLVAYEPWCTSSYDALGKQVISCPDLCGEGLHLGMACDMQCVYGGNPAYGAIHYCAAAVLLQVGDCAGTIPHEALEAGARGKFDVDAMCVPAGCEGKISRPAATAQNGDAQQQPLPEAGDGTVGVGDGIPLDNQDAGAAAETAGQQQQPDTNQENNDPRDGNLPIDLDENGNPVIEESGVFGMHFHIHASIAMTLSLVIGMALLN